VTVRVRVCASERGGERVCESERPCEGESRDHRGQAKSGARPCEFIAHIMFSKTFVKSQLLHKSVNFILVIIKDKLTDLCDYRLLY